MQMQDPSLAMQQQQQLPQVQHGLNAPQINPEIAEGFSNMSLNDLRNKVYENNKIPNKLRHFINSENIADEIDEYERTKIVDICLRAAEIDEQSRWQWKETMTQAFDLIDPYYETKNYPWEGAANIKFPMIMSACMQFNARTNPEIIKHDRAVRVRLMLNDDPQHQLSDRANRLSGHMSYQLIGQSTHWVSDTDKLLMMLPLLGVVFRKSFFNTVTGQPDTTLCLPKDIIINDKTQTLDSAQRITHVLYMSANEILEGMRAGIYIDYPITELSETIDPEDKEQEIESYSSDDKEYARLMDVMHEVHEQHRWLDLDGDGYQEPYIVTYHKDSRKLLRILARYDVNSFEFNKKGEFTKINAKQYFTDYHLIPDPRGSYYSLGFGALLMALNATVNTTLNQLIDAGTLSNNGGGFIGSDLRLPKGDYRFKPGEWKTVPSAPGTVISQSIVPMPVKEPSQVLFALMQFLIESSKAITAVSDVMAGEQPPANQPATTTMAILEQGQQIYSSILYRVYDSLKREFQKLYEINRCYLNDEESFPLAEGVGMVTIQDYEQPEYGIFPVADPKVSSQMERLLQANSLMQLLAYPEVNHRAVIANFIQTLKIQDPNQFLNPEPDPKDPPPLDVQQKQAELELLRMKKADILMKHENDAIANNIKEQEQQTKAAYYGGDLAAKKIDSIVKLTQLEQAATSQEIGTAVKEEESLTQSTQMQDQPVAALQRLDSLEEAVGQMLGNMQQQVIPPMPQQQQQQPIAGNPQVPQIPMPEQQQ
jgi:chaperonin GroES